MRVPCRLRRRWSRLWGERWDGHVRDFRMTVCVDCGAVIPEENKEKGQP